jgi:hypothetical protein
MFKFLFGAAVTSVAFYVMGNHPEWVQRTVALGRRQIAVASRNVSAMASSENASPASRLEDRPTTINSTRARQRVSDMKALPADELWQVMDGDDYDSQAAAALVLLARAKIPASAEGIAVVNRKYLKSNRPELVRTGFSYLGLLALQDVPDISIIRSVQGYVERHPQDPACDNALWALGQLGSEQMVPYFFEVAENERKYGPAARERAFCCLVQCGRYSLARRSEMVPSLIEIYEESRDPQTRVWTLQALAHCAPRAQVDSIDEWKSWWATQ